MNGRRYWPQVPQTIPRTAYRGLTGMTTHSPGPGRTSWLGQRVHTLGGERKASPLQENESFDPPEPIRLGYPHKEVSGPTPS